MFRKSTTNKQLDIFNSITALLQGKAHDKYLNPDEWHNLFRINVFENIDEDIFSKLFDAKMGSPNASIKRTISMMILKEGFGWSDKELFENCNFNVLVRSALSMFDLKERVPSESTYYEHKRKIYRNEITTGEDLIEKVFDGITGKQAMNFGVKAEAIRMDSKLIGSNIANCSRYELIHGVIKEFYKSLNDFQRAKLSKESKLFLENLQKEDQEKVLYYSRNNELTEKIQRLGNLMYLLTKLFNESDSDYYSTMLTVFKQQFKIDEKDEKIELKAKNEIRASSIQSPHDTDSAYRKKGNQEIQGTVVNITETCNETGLNLITKPDVKPATAADNSFYKNGVEKTQEILEDKVKKSYQDGAYHSKENDKFNKDNDIEMLLTGIQGRESNFEFELTQDGFEVEDLSTGNKQKAVNTKSGKYRIKDAGGKYRYFSLEQISNYYKRKRINNIPQEEQNKRNNVEAAMFQLSLFTRNNKIRYRGLIETKIWANMRCLWINLVRIKNYMGKLCPDFNQINNTTKKISQIVDILNGINVFKQIFQVILKKENNMLILS
ncbi:MAG: transposase [Desulfobacula sp.]|nr:transposase [Desulfobacula sp.]